MAEPNDDDLIIEADPTEIETAEPEIEVVKADEGKVTTPAAAPAEDPIEKLKAQLAEANDKTAREAAARQAAEREAQEAMDRANKAQTQTYEGQLQLVENALASVKKDIEAQKARYAEAGANGDYGAMAEIQAEMAEAASKKIQLEAGLDQMKNRPAPQPQRFVPSDPVEKFLTETNMTPKSAAWIRRHPEYATNPNFTRRMLAAHNLVIDDVELESPEYFAGIERALGLNDNARLPGEEPLEVMSAAAEPTQRRAAPAAAPVSRAASPATPNGRRTVTLTAAQREAAEASGLSYKEYAEQLLKIEDENRGRLN